MERGLFFDPLYSHIAPSLYIAKYSLNQQP